MHVLQVTTLHGPIQCLWKIALSVLQESIAWPVLERQHVIKAIIALKERRLQHNSHALQAITTMPLGLTQ